MYEYPRRLRLTKADEFSSVFILGHARRGKFLKIHYKPNELVHSRLGLIVSKKNHKRANKRNYMKRLLRELFRLSQAQWLGHDVIVRVQQCFTRADFVLVRAEFIQLSHKMQKVITQNNP